MSDSLYPFLQIITFVLLILFSISFMRLLGVFVLLKARLAKKPFQDIDERWGKMIISYENLKINPNPKLETTEEIKELIRIIGEKKLGKQKQMIREYNLDFIAFLLDKVASLMIMDKCTLSSVKDSSFIVYRDLLVRHIKALRWAMWQQNEEKMYIHLSRIVTTLVTRKQLMVRDRNAISDFYRSHFIRDILSLSDKLMTPEKRGIIIIDNFNDKWCKNMEETSDMDLIFIVNCLYWMYEKFGSRIVYTKFNEMFTVYRRLSLFLSELGSSFQKEQRERVLRCLAEIYRTYELPIVNEEKSLKPLEER